MGRSAIFEPAPDGVARRLARGSRRPVVRGAEVAAAGYVVLTVLLVSLGLLVTGAFVHTGLGRWDASVERWLFEHRTALLDDLTAYGGMIGDTFTVIGVAAVAVLILALGRHWTQIGFLVAALLIEVTTFLTTTFLIDRGRPEVPHLDAGPPTSSFPSGHTAAAVVLYVGLALIVTSLVGSRLVRVLMWTLAVILPLAVAGSRLYRGMHFPTDVIGSLIGAAGCLAFAMLATRTGVAVADREPTSPHDHERPIAVPEVEVAR